MGEVANVGGVLPAMVRKAASFLEGAVSHAEVLDAKRMAQAVFTTAKAQARMAKAKAAHTEVLAAIRATQAQALEIEAKANERLADEYDAAQERGEVATQARHGGSVPAGNAAPVTAADLGLTRKDIHEARQVRDAEKASPGIVKRTLDAIVQRGEEPTKAAVRAVVQAVQPKPAAAPAAEPPASNVVQLGARLNVMPTEGKVERDLIAEEGAAEHRDAEEFDSTKVEHRARAINGALNTFDHVRLTGLEYWQVYGKSPARETFVAWVRAAKSTIDDILKEYEHGNDGVRETGSNTSAGRVSKKGSGRS